MKKKHLPPTRHKSAEMYSFLLPFPIPPTLLIFPSHQNLCPGPRQGLSRPGVIQRCTGRESRAARSWPSWGPDDQDLGMGTTRSWLRRCIHGLWSCRHREAPLYLVVIALQSSYEYQLMNTNINKSRACCTNCSVHAEQELSISQYRIEGDKIFFSWD